MDFLDSPAEAAFRDEVRMWLAEHLVGEFAELGGGGGAPPRNPTRASFFGEGLFAPTLLAYGTEAQKRRFLPKIQAADEFWCQGYSEPNAGSDLSNAQTRAVL